MIILSLLIISMTSNIHAFTSDGTEVKLQVQMVLASGGIFLNGDYDITVRLKTPNTVLWEKLYTGTERVTINQGALLLQLKGKDNNNITLVASIFDSEGVFLEIEIANQIVSLDLVSQPYAIKSRISDESHSTKKLQGIPVQKVTTVNAGDFLIVNAEGRWVPSSLVDGFTGIPTNLKRTRTIKDLDDVTFKGINKGQILGYDGNQWVNIEDQKLSEADVDAIVRERGYLKEVGSTLIKAGNYDQITGIGGNIRTSPNIRLNTPVHVAGALTVDGTIGTSGGAITRVFAKEFIIVSGNEQVRFTESGGKLNLNVPVKVSGKNGVLLSAAGKSNRLGIFKGADELEFDDTLIWDGGKKQLALGGTTDLSGVKLNVEGGLRISGQLIVGNSVLSLAEYVKMSQLHNVATSGKYSDLIGIPSINLYVKHTELTAKLNAEHYKKSEANTEIDRRINVFKDGTLQAEFTTKLTPYETAAQRNTKLTQELTSYYTKTAADTQFIDPSELTTQLANYATETKIKDQLLQPYIKTISVSTLGRTGLWKDILQKPELVTKNELNTYKTLVSNTYATTAFLNSELTSRLQAATTSVLSKVNQDFLSKSDYNADTGTFAKVASLNALKDVARTGSYNDLTGRPDISNFLAKSSIENSYVSHTELTTSLSVYIKSDAVKTVGKTGLYADLEGEPDMSLFQKVSSMNIYITSANLANQLRDVVRTGSGTTIDLTGYEKTADITTKLQEYPKSNTLHNIATSGKFDDLIGSANIVTLPILSTQLGNYIASTNLTDAITQLENKFLDSAELSTSFNVLKSEIFTSRNTTLLDYYTKTSADAKIDEKLIAFKTNVIIPTVNTMLQTRVSTTDLQTTLANYKTSENVVTYVNSVLSKFVSTENLNLQLAYYSTTASINAKNYLRYDTVDNVKALRLANGPVLVTANVNIFGVTTLSNLELPLGSLPATYIYDDSITSKQIKSDSIETFDIKDGTLKDIDVSPSANITFSKLNISALDIRGKTPYKAGTGIQLDADGEFSIGQDVATSATPTFAVLKILGKTGVSPSVTVEGTLRASKFQGDGSELRNISANNISGQINASEVSGSLIASQIADDAITGVHIQASAVDTAEIKNGAVTPEKLAQIPFTKITQNGTNIRGLTPYSAGSGVSIDSAGNIAIGQNVTKTSEPEFKGVKIVDGDVLLEKSATKRIKIKNLHVTGELSVGLEDPTAQLQVAGGIIANSFSGDGANLTNVPNIPSGVIVMWHGAIDVIPDGWALCNGQQPTNLAANVFTIPDLSSRFIVGYDANSTDYNAIAKRGGSASTTLQETNIPAHNHTATIATQSTNHNHTGTIGTKRIQHTHNISGTSVSAGGHTHSINNSTQSHRHNHIYTNYDVEVKNDDFNYSGGPSQISLRYGGHDNGYFRTGDTSQTHNHSMNSAGGHTHSMNFTSGNNDFTHDHTLSINDNSQSHSHTITIDNSSGGSTPIDNRPPYYVVAFIIKLPTGY